MDDHRLVWGAPERNKAPLAAVLGGWLPAGARVLEIASGTGQHAAWFAQHLDLWWIPSDPDPDHVRSIAAWRAHGGLERLAEPLALDVAERPWPVDRVDAVFCANMIHIAPWQAALDLLAGAREVVRADGLLVLYGPFVRTGVPTAPSNLAFDASLRERDPRWGIRHLDEVVEAADGFGLDEVREMPANNVAVRLRRG